MAKASVKVNINNVFALSNRTIGEARFFTTLESAIESNNYDSSNEIDIVELNLQDNEFVPVEWYDIEGNVIEVEDEELPTRFEGSE